MTICLQRRLVNNFRLFSSDSAFSAVFWHPPPWIMEDASTSYRDKPIRLKLINLMNWRRGRIQRKGKGKRRILNQSSAFQRRVELLNTVNRLARDECEAEGGNNISSLKALFKEVNMAYKMMNPLLTYYTNQRDCGELKEATLEDALPAFKEFCTQFVQSKSPNMYKRGLEVARETYCQMVNAEHRKQEEEVKKMNKLEKRVERLGTNSWFHKS